MRRGDVLIELEDARVDASVDLLRAQLAADRLRQSRLEAEAAGREAWEPAGRAPGGVRRREELRRAAGEGAGRVRRAAKQRDGAGRGRAAPGWRTRAPRSTSGSGSATTSAARWRSSARSSRCNERLEREQYVQSHPRDGACSAACSDDDVAQPRQRGRARAGPAAPRCAGSPCARRCATASCSRPTEELREVGARVADTEQRLRASADDRRPADRAGAGVRPPGQPARQHARPGPGAARADRRHRAGRCAAAGRGAAARSRWPPRCTKARPPR